MNTTGKWIDGLSPDTPLRDAVARILDTRFEAVAGFLAPATSRNRGGVEAVHKLRVSTRRLDAALRAFSGWLGEDECRKARRKLRSLRRAAGCIRDCDVIEPRLAERFAASDSGTTAALHVFLASLAAERESARKSLARVVAKRNAPSMRTLALRFVETAHSLGSSAGDIVFRDAATAIVPSLSGRVRRRWEGDLQELERVHALRIELKRLRYALEIFEPCLGEESHSEVFPTLREAQDRLGALNDAEAAGRRVQGFLEHTDAAPHVREGLAHMVETLRADADAAHAEFLAQWPADRADRFLVSIESLVQRPAARSLEPDDPPWNAPPRPHAGPDAPPQINGRRARRDTADAPRVAVIDVGTNSIRLIVAEALDDGSYRVVDDEKETSRLGAGLNRVGVLTVASMQRAARIISHMMRIAEGYRVEHIRAIGTAAVRKAPNRDEFIDIVRNVAGIELEPISAAEEARLAYTSAAASFDLTECDAAVMDVGGGSTEIVLSAQGVVDRVYLLPLGAVFLTEHFGGPIESCGPRYREMREHVFDAMGDVIGEPPFTPDLFVASGGACTSLAAMAVAMDTGAAQRSASPAAIRSQVVRRAHVERLLDRLRRLSVSERAETPGLPPDRADIIVASLVLVDAAMETLGARALRVHERGIRDGLLRQIIAGSAAHGRDTAGPPDPRQSVDRFADTCRFERDHCDHVAGLAVQIFDQLAQQTEPEPDERRQWRGAGSRLLLESAGVLHDVGYHINYARHHKHSYHLIIHSELPGFTPREVAIIANVARYHRRARPRKSHEEFASLRKRDRDLVTRLAAVLRVADGLDRSHTGNVERVDVHVENGAATFVLHASHDPDVEVWGAERKADMFTRVFGLEARFCWAAAGSTPPDAAEPRGASAAATERPQAQPLGESCR